MGRRVKQRTAVDAPRRLTRQGLRSLAARLPVEIVRMLVVFAAHDSIGRLSKWVAQCLVLVCREFQTAVEPVLVDTVRITLRNAFALLAQKHRFAQTKHLIFDDRARRFPQHIAYALLQFFPSVVSFAGGRDLVRIFAELGARPTSVSLHGVSGDAGQLAAGTSLEPVTHLHVQNYSTNYVLFDDLPPGITHLVVNPSSHQSRKVLSATTIASILRENLSLQRLLVRTIHLYSDERAAFVSELCALEQREPDARLWLDDSISYGPDRYGAQAQLDYEEANDHHTIWYTGRQLHVGAEAASSAQ